MVYFIVEQLDNNIATSTITKNININAEFISKILPYLSIANATLSRVFCINAFKGNFSKYKCQVSILDGKFHQIIDILECRHKHFIRAYLKKFSKQQLDIIKYLVTHCGNLIKILVLLTFVKQKLLPITFTGLYMLVIP